MRRALVLGLAITALLGGVASGQQAKITQHMFDDRGLPTLVGNPSPDGSKGRVIAWRECRPGRACTKIPLGRKDVRRIDPGNGPAGTRWEVTVRSNGGRLTTDRSMAWQGRVTAETRPRVTGRLRAGRVIRPRPAEWRGGWRRGDFSFLGLEACPTRAGRRCETLSSEEHGLPAACRGRGAVLADRYEGWWVRAIDARYAGGTAFPGVYYGRARNVPVSKPGRTLARSRLAGPVRPRNGPRASCAPR